MFRQIGHLAEPNRHQHIAVKRREGPGKLHLLSHRSCSQVPSSEETNRDWKAECYGMLQNCGVSASVSKSFFDLILRTKAPNATRASSRTESDACDNYSYSVGRCCRGDL